MKKLRVLGGFAAVGLIALATTARADTPVRGGTLTYAVQGETSTYDCHAGSSFSNIHFLAPHFSLLVRFSPVEYPKIVPDLAKSWTVSDDGLTYTFKLNEGVKFHDGSVLTAKDQGQLRAHLEADRRCRVCPRGAFRGARGH